MPHARRLGPVPRMSEGLYVYCVIGTGDARNFGPLGIGGRGEPVTTIAYRDLSAVVSSVPMNKYVVGQETILAHERVLETVMNDHAALPVRFHTVAPNAEEIRSLLRTRYGEFRQLLRQLDNKVELGLKAIWKDMNRVLQNISREWPQDKGLSGTAEASLGENSALGAHRVRLALEERKARERERLLQRFRRLAVDLRLNKTYGDDMIMNTAFLVDRSREREFDALVQQLGAQCLDSIEFKYVGPAPPYSFVNIVIKDELGTGHRPGKER